MDEVIDQARGQDRGQPCQMLQPSRKYGFYYRKDLYAAVVAVASLLYLSLPLFIFFAGWLRLVVAIPMILLLSTAVSLAAREEYRTYLHSQPHYGFIDSKHVIVLSLSGLLLLVWTYYAGVGFNIRQNGDYYKHSGMLHDLITNDWPITYYIDPDKTAIAKLVYYFGWYLPGALVGKWVSVEAAHHFQLGWTYLGVLMGFAWIVRLSRGRGLWPVLIVILFSGMDIVGYFLYNAKLPKITAQIEWWNASGVWQYSGNTSALYWVPQHYLATVIATPLVIRFLMDHQRNGKNLSGLYFGLTLFWSPFVALGLTPYVIYGMVKARFRQILRIENVAGGITALILLAFFLSRGSDPYHYFVLTPQSLPGLWLAYVLFISLEYGGVFLLMWQAIRVRRDLFHLTVFSALLLLLFPVYHVGYWHDFTMRTSLPSLWVMQLAVLFYLAHTQQNVKRQLVIVLLGIGFLNSGLELTRAWERRHRPPLNMPSVTAHQDWPWVIYQYLGRPQALFFRYLAKPSDTAIFVLSNERLDNYEPYRETFLKKKP